MKEVSMQYSRDPVAAPLTGLLRTPGLSTTFWFRKLLNAAVLCGGDLLAISSSLALTSQVMGWPPTGLQPSDWLVALGGWLGGARLLHLTPNWGVSTAAEVKGLTKLTLLVFAGLAGLEVLQQGVSLSGLLALALGLVLAWPLILLTRPLLRGLLLRAGLWGVPVAIYGHQGSGAQLAAALHRNPEYGYRPAEVIEDLPACSAVPGVPVAILSMAGLPSETLRHLLDGPLAAYESVVILPDLAEVEFLCVSARDVAGVTGLQIQRPQHGPLALGAKRLLDLLGVALLAPSLLGICALIALALWLETRTSPVFLQQRIGLRGKPFITWKFRTMLPDAEEVLRRTLAESPELRAEWEANFKLRDDPRITRLGALLRKTSLDELPQLLNVLLGDMSLVGPRPLPKYHCEDLPLPAQVLRSYVRPGMTGLWQVSGRSDAGTSGMVRWDSYYVRNWSVWLDLVILIRTVQVVIRGVGAY
jgi:Undecaprenyl-phosphate galactose phosphotransferase WbaP